MFNLIPWRKKELTRGDADSPLTLFRDEFDSLLERMFRRFPFALDEWQPGASWGFEMQEDDKEYVFRAEAPGFEADDFDVQVQGNVLTISAEKKQEAGERKGNGYAYSERKLQRSVTLPAGADTKDIQARYHNGILELTLQKLPQAQGRRITVKKA